MDSKYKVGDKVRIKSIDWYNENVNEIDEVHCGNTVFIPDMVQYINDIVTISDVFPILGIYRIIEDSGVYNWTDEMIEGLVEEENSDCEKCGLTHNSTRCLFMDNCPHNQSKNTIEIPEGWVAKDESGNEILTSKIILEKKKKEYPKTYEECFSILGLGVVHGLNYADNFDYLYKGEELYAFQKLLVCLNAYWKIAGEKMGLSKAWEPDYNDLKNPMYGLYYELKDSILNPSRFVFPTEEMRDAFKENFDPDIEICKEFL